MSDAYRVVITPSAEREMRRLPNREFKRITDRIFRLAENPRPAGCVKLTGEVGYRIRQGDYRILYAVDDEGRMVLIRSVGHRKDVYRR